METRRRGGKGVVLVLLIFILPAICQATSITFTSSGTIGAGDIYDNVYLENDGTVVDMTGGQIKNIIFYDKSTFNFSGGQISESGSYIDISALGNFNMTGGIADLFGFYLTGAGAASIYGGTISVDNVKMDSNAKLTLDNAIVYFGDLDIIGGCVVNITGGDVHIGDLGVTYFSGAVNIMGGNVYIGDLDASNHNGAINIYGYDFDYDSTTEILSGYLQDDNYFEIGEVSESEFTSLNLIPEPSTFLLLGFGWALLGKRK